MDKIKDDTGKRVKIFSIGGPSYPDDKWKRALENVGGTVLWGPKTFTFTAQAKVESTKPLKEGQKPSLRPKKFVTDFYWGVLVDDYGIELRFVAEELRFVK